jgi:hypothetical protein
VGTPDQKKFTPYPVHAAYRTHDTKQQVASIIADHDYGIFRISAPFVEEMVTDDRVWGCLEQRIAALSAAPVEIGPAEDNAKARRVADDLGVNGEKLWQDIIPGTALRELMKWGLMLGVAVAQIVWERGATAWVPRLVPWHPQWLRWDWMQRRYVLLTGQGEVVLPRTDEQPRSDGNWFVWTPWGYEYGWRSALIRQLGEKYLMRQWDYRDWARYCEAWGQPFLVGMVPADADGESKQLFFDSLGNLGSEGVVMAPKGADGQASFDVQRRDPTGTSADVFQRFKEAIDMDIAVLILGQNLTTQVDGGSLAASKVHNLVRLDKAKQDAGIRHAIRGQVLTWWAEHNYGTADLAPKPAYNVDPPEDDVADATAVQTLATACETLKRVEPSVDIVAMLEEAKVPLIAGYYDAGGAGEGLVPGAPPAPPQPSGGFGEGGEIEEDEPEADDKKAKAKLPAKLKKAKLTALRADPSLKRFDFQGLQIVVENPAGSRRKWKDPTGVEGETHMMSDYGFIDGHYSGDGEELDCYVGPQADAPDVFIVHQLAAPDFKRHDEDKCMLGYHHATAAKQAYLAHRNDGERAFGGMSIVPMAVFKRKLTRRVPASTAKIRATAYDADDALAEIMRLVTLRATPRKAAGAKEAATYEDRLMASARAHAAKALAPTLERLRSEIDAATSPDDLRKRVVEAFKTMHPGDLARVVEKANILAHMSGRFQALEEI